MKWISLDGESLQIRENLWHFLVQLRHKNASSGHVADECRDTLWVDAICIDQSNIAERNQQVAMMGDIYSTATRVAAWLGTESDDSALAVQQMRNPEATSEWSLKEAQALVNLFSRPYWRRAWIVQEVVLARELDFYCGRERFSVQGLTARLPILEELVAHDSVSSIATPLVEELCGTPAIDIVQRRVRWQQSKPHAKGLKFYLLLGNLMNMQASDRRDRVYALLSLGRQDELRGLRLRADYSKTTREVYEQVLRGLARVKTPHEEIRQLAAQLQLALGFQINDFRLADINRKFDLGELSRPDPPGALRGEAEARGRDLGRQASLDRDAGYPQRDCERCKVNSGSDAALNTESSLPTVPIQPEENEVLRTRKGSHVSGRCHWRGRSLEIVTIKDSEINNPGVCECISHTYRQIIISTATE
jgi:hypothetical protein